MSKLSASRAQATQDPAKVAHEILTALAGEDARSIVAWTPTEDELTASLAQGAASGGPLAGATYGLKDLFDVAGVPTKAGSSFLAEVRPTPTADSLIVQKLAAAGAVMAAKVHLVEFAYGLSGENMWYGDAPHPTVPIALAGGSSSGSAWIARREITSFAIGTDTAGSMRVPAAYCGLYAWRDVPGPLTQQGCFPLARSFDTAGWFSRCPTDLLAISEVLLDAPDGEIDQPKVLDLTALCPTLSPELRAAGQPILEQLGAVEDADALALIRDAFADNARAYNILGSTEAYALHKDWLDVHRDRYDPVVWGRIDRGRRWSAEDFAWAKSIEARVQKTLAEVFQHYDALALPVTPVASPGKAAMTEGYRTELLNLTTPFSLGRTPALTIPVQLADGKSGGIQIGVRRNCRLSILHALVSRLA